MDSDTQLYIDGQWRRGRVLIASQSERVNPFPVWSKPQTPKVRNADVIVEHPHLVVAGQLADSADQVERIEIAARLQQQPFNHGVEVQR